MACVASIPDEWDQFDLQKTHQWELVDRNPVEYHHNPHWTHHFYSTVAKIAACPTMNNKMSNYIISQLWDFIITSAVRLMWNFLREICRCMKDTTPSRACSAKWRPNPTSALQALPCNLLRNILCKVRNILSSSKPISARGLERYWSTCWHWIWLRPSHLHNTVHHYKTQK